MELLEGEGVLLLELASYGIVVHLCLGKEHQGHYALVHVLLAENAQEVAVTVVGGVEVGPMAAVCCSVGVQVVQAAHRTFVRPLPMVWAGAYCRQGLCKYVPYEDVFEAVWVLRGELAHLPEDHCRS